MADKEKAEIASKTTGMQAQYQYRNINVECTSDMKYIVCWREYVEHGNHSMCDSVEQKEVYDKEGKALDRAKELHKMDLEQQKKQKKSYG